ncbi:hypothetical protein TB2_019366 [Malus domestica]
MRGAAVACVWPPNVYEEKSVVKPGPGSDSSESWQWGFFSALSRVVRMRRQQLKRAATYDYKNDPMWADYWSNIPIPPDPIIPHSTWVCRPQHPTVYSTAFSIKQSWSRVMIPCVTLLVSLYLSINY